MKRLLLIILTAWSLLATAQTVTWEAGEAFADKGLMLPFTSIDGASWTLGSGISISFLQAEGAEFPDISTRPAAAWLYPGNQLLIQAPEGITLTQVRITTLDDTSFAPEGITLSSGSAQCSGALLSWQGEAAQLTIGPANTFATIHEPGARAAITEIQITYSLPQEDGIHQLRLPHTRARLTIRHRHLHYIWR